MVSEPCFLISAFLKDVLNEITTFASPEGAQGGPKSLQSLPAQIRNQFETLLNSCFDFWTLLSALAGGPGRSTPFRRPGPPSPPGTGFQATFAPKV